MIEIKQLEGFDIPKILELDNKVEKIMGVEIGEWVQFLSQIASNEHSSLMVVGAYNEDKFEAYMLISYFKMPPISNALNVIYFFSKMNHYGNMAFFKKVVEWAYEMGFEKIRMATDDPERFEKWFGFKNTNKILMEYPIIKEE